MSDISDINLADLTNAITDLTKVDNLPEAISSLTPSQVRQIWQEFFFDQDQVLVKTYNLNQNKLNKFIEGTRHYGSAINSIQLFIAKQYGLELPSPTPQFKTNRQICQLIKDNQPKYIIIIDGDNSANALKLLNRIIPKDSPNFLVIFAISKSMTPSIMMEMRKVPWLSFISVNSGIKNALDHTITFLVGSLCYLDLDPCPNIILISHDEFICTVRDELLNHDCLAHCFDIWVDSSLDLLAMLPLDLLSNEANQMATNIPPQQQKDRRPAVVIPTINSASYDILDKLKSILTERQSIILSILGQELPIREKDNLPRQWKKALSPNVLSYLGARLDTSDNRRPILRLVNHDY